MTLLAVRGQCFLVFERMVTPMAVQLAFHQLDPLGVGQLVLCQGGFATEAFVAGRANKVAFSRVYGFVSIEVAFEAEPLRAISACKRLLSSVRS